MVVGSLALLFAVFVSPPPLTLAVLVTDPAAVGVTVRVIVGAVLPAVRVVERLQDIVVAGAELQLQPLPVAPEADTYVRPVGIASVTVYVPLVAVVPTFLTESE